MESVHQLFSLEENIMKSKSLVYTACFIGIGLGLYATSACATVPYWIIT